MDRVTSPARRGPASAALPSWVRGAGPPRGRGESASGRPATRGAGLRGGALLAAAAARVPGPSLVQVEQHTLGTVPVSGAPRGAASHYFLCLVLC